MNFRSKLKYKGLERKEAGVFKNDKGEEINYNSKYVLYVDDMTQDGIKERKFNIKDDAGNTQLLEDLKKLQIYQDVNIEFEVVFTSTGMVRVEPRAIIK